jgi:hypothetical protein
MPTFKLKKKIVSYVPCKQFEIDKTYFKNDAIMMRELDPVNFKNVYIIHKWGNRISKHYLVDMVKGSVIYILPRENYVFPKDITDLDNRYIIKNFITYNSDTQILTYITNSVDSNKTILFESFKLSYIDFKFKVQTLNKLEISINTNNYSLHKLPSSNNVVIYKQYQPVDCKLVIIDLFTLDIIMEYTNKTYCNQKYECVPGGPQLSLSDSHPGLMFIIGNTELIIYDYNDNKELETIQCSKTPVIQYQQCDNYYIVDTGKNLLFYKFIDEDDIPKDNKCVICFSQTDRKSALVPCGHTQLCNDCIERTKKGLLKTCPLCRSDIDSVIKIY